MPRMRPSSASGSGKSNFGNSTYGFGDSDGSRTAERIGGAAQQWLKTAADKRNKGNDFNQQALATALGEHIKLQAGMIDREHFVDHIGKAGEHFEGGTGFNFQSGNHSVNGTLRVRPVTPEDTQGGGVGPQMKQAPIDLGFIPSTTTGPNRPTQTNTSTPRRTPLAIEAPKPKTTFEAASPHIIPNTTSQVEGVVTGENKTVDRSSEASVNSHLSGEENAYLSIFNDRRRAATPTPSLQAAPLSIKNRANTLSKMADARLNTQYSAINQAARKREIGYGWISEGNTPSAGTNSTIPTNPRANIQM
jgi:hypothetical protein